MTLAEVSSVCNGLVVKDEMRWNHTAASMALLANINSSKGKSFKPKDFNPYSQIGENKKVTKDKVQQLYETFKKL